MSPGRRPAEDPPDTRATPPASGHAAEAPPADSATAFLTEMLAARKMSRVRPSMPRAGDLVNQARAHIRSVQLVAATDPTLALAACHDAIRKSLDAHAGAAGYRFENSPGAHRATLEYGREVLGEIVATDDFAEAERLRQRRHGTEYGELPAAQIGADEVGHFAAVASRIVNAVANDLSSR